MGTTFPIEITAERLIEFLAGPGLGTIRSISEQEIGRDVFKDPSPTSEDSAGVQMLLMAMNGKTGEEIRDWLHNSKEAEDYRNHPIPEPGPVADEHGLITIQRPVMIDENGKCWQWRGVSHFLLLYRMLTGSPDVDKMIDDWIILGANVFRIFAMVDWDECNPRFHPQNFPNYQEVLDQLADKLAAKHVRFELVLFADAQIVMPDTNQRQQFVRDSLDTLRGKWNKFVEIANEPWQNLPGGDQEAIDLAKMAVDYDPSCLIASGEYRSWPPAETAKYGTTHCDRTSDWPRKAKDLMDRSDNSNHTPWIGDEPMGAADIDQPGKRDTDPNNFAWYATGSQMFGTGSTFHCEAGIHSLATISPIQISCAKAFYFGLLWIPCEATLWPYQRGDSGSEEGIGNMPIMHDDNLETRSYCKGDGSTEWCIQIQTTREHAVPRDGWRIVEEPRHGFVKLVKP